jgi:hypothetical protein
VEAENRVLIDCVNKLEDLQAVQTKVGESPGRRRMVPVGLKV